MRVIIDGEAVDARSASVSIFDWSVIRGLGAFEVVRTVDGGVLHLEEHLDRLEASLAALHLPSVSIESVSSWTKGLAEENDDGLIRIVVTAGARDLADDPVDAHPKVMIVWEPLPTIPDLLSLMPLRSPWHPGTSGHAFAGVKWLSYAPNMVSTDIAVSEGFDDALLTTMDDIVLELPTASVAWVSDGRLVTPSLDLGILLSITRDIVIGLAGDLGIGVVEGRFTVADLLAADEVMALSTGKLVAPVGRIGDTTFAAGPVTRRLSDEYRARIGQD